MRCSECSSYVKPVVAIDIDGTLADYHQHFLSFSLNYLGYKDGSPVPSELVTDPYTGSGSFKTWWTDCFGVGEETWRDVKLAYRTGANKRFQPTIDPPDKITGLFNALNEVGVEVWVTTTRPYLSLDRIDRDTRFWLANNGIWYYGLLYDDDKYEVLAERVDHDRVIAVVDDQVDMLESARNLWGGRTPIMRRTKWNSSVGWTTVLDNLDDVGGEIVSRAHLWYKKHDHHQEITND